MEPAIIEHEVLKLPLVERAVLIDRVLQSLDIELVKNITVWAEVAAKRMELFHSGKITALDHEAAIETLRHELRR